MRIHTFGENVVAILLRVKYFLSAIRFHESSESVLRETLQRWLVKSLFLKITREENNSVRK